MPNKKKKKNACSIQSPLSGVEVGSGPYRNLLQNDDEIQTLDPLKVFLYSP